MAQNNMSFKQAVNELGLGWEPHECELISKRKEFKQVLRTEKNTLYGDVANMPGRTKSTAVGMLLVSLENLLEQGEFDKVISGVEKLARLEGWLGADSNINVFAGLTSRDIAEQKQKLLDSIKGTSADS